MRRVTLLAVIVSLLAISVPAQESRPRRIQQMPAATIKAPTSDAKAAPRAFSSVPFAPGETLTYDVEWNRNTTAATVVLNVGERGTYFGREALPLSADIQTVGFVRLLAAVKVDYDSYSDPKTLLPYRTESSSSINGKNASDSIVFDRSKNVAVNDETRTPIADETGDALSILYRLRALPLRVGAEYLLDAFDGRKRFEVKAIIEGREQVSTKAGRFDAFRVAFLPVRGGEAEDTERIRVWYSDTPSRLPVLVTAHPRFGPVRATLKTTKGTRS